MIYYVDTSALVKIYARERGSEPMKEIMNGPHDLFISRVAYCEVLCALARKHREGELSNNEYSDQVSKFKADWLTLYVLEVTHELLEPTENLSHTYPLKALDVIHLCSAERLKDSIEPAEDFAMLCSNGRLKSAAAYLGMRVSDPEEGCGGYPAS